MHDNQTHEGIKFSCGYCEYKTTKKEALLRHIKSMHEGVKFSCDQCNYEATKKNSILTHIKSVHINRGVAAKCKKV